MNFLVNLPTFQCFVKTNFLSNDITKPIELREAYWVTAKSIKGRALYIESYLPEYAAVYDKLPISAYVWKEDYDKDNQLELGQLQLWDCFSYDITIIKKSFLDGLRCKVFIGKNQYIYGEYMFTIDSAHADPNTINTTLSETPNEHKSFNFIKLDNGQIAAQPNNRIQWFDQSITPTKLLPLDLRTSTEIYTCEGGGISAGDDTNYFYTINERTDVA